MISDLRLMILRCVFHKGKTEIFVNGTIIKFTLFHESMTYQA
jgi:hypothetical protein